MSSWMDLSLGSRICESAVNCFLDRFFRMFGCRSFHSLSWLPSGVTSSESCVFLALKRAEIACFHKSSCSAVLIHSSVIWSLGGIFCVGFGVRSSLRIWLMVGSICLGLKMSVSIFSSIWFKSSRCLNTMLLFVAVLCFWVRNSF